LQNYMCTHNISNIYFQPLYDKYKETCEEHFISSWYDDYQVGMMYSLHDSLYLLYSGWE
jgi:hypothetical protein